jgi:hypothetical protein
MDQISGFPKNLAYNLKRLQGAIIKQKININSDKNLYYANERVMFNFPVGRKIDQRSITATAKCTINTAGNHFPRGGLNSLIENLSISCNSRIIQSTQCYNYIWNAIADASGYFSPEQYSKRLYENFDPSLNHTNPQGEGAIVTTNAAIANTGNDSYYFCINSWLGYFSSSCSTLDLNNLGQLQLIITLAPDSCLWLGCLNGANTIATAGTYKVEEFILSMDTITFTNSLYEDLVKSQLEGSGLNIAYNDYLVSIGSVVPKSTSGITQVAQFSTNSLDAVYATFRPEKYQTPTVLLLGNAIVDMATRANERGSSLTYPEVIANPVSNEGGGMFGGFNQSQYFQRDGGGIDYTSWYINSTPFTVNSTPIQIFNNLLQSLDYANLDIASGGINQGAITTGIYNKNYFLDALSLENLSGDNGNWVSGYGGNSGVITIQYNARFKTLTNNVIPIIIGKVSKIMNIKIGRNVDIEE